ncbi:MAG: hypothetical protein AAFU67_01515 [Bacteroidota bacterium]
MFFGLQNPIPYEAVDKDHLANWIKEHRAIPYYGSFERSSHRFLWLLRDLADLSPTYSACMRARKNYTFGMNVNIADRSTPELADEEIVVDFNDQVAFRNQLQDYGINLNHLPKIGRRAEDHLQQSGNAYLRIRRSRVGGVVRYQMTALHYLHCLYKVSEDPGERFLLHSKYLHSTDSINSHPPTIYRVTPQGEPLRWMEEGDGVEATVVHLMYTENNSDGDYYDRSPLIPFLTYLYTDFQSGNHISKVAAAEFVTKLLIAIEQEDPQAFNSSIGEDGEQRDSFTEIAREIKEMTTSMATQGNHIGAKSGQASIGLFEYPNGAKPPTTIPLEVNRDTKYLEMQIEKAAAMVASACGWSITLTELRPAKATLGGNLLYDTFVMKNTETIVPRQTFWENIFNDILLQICEEENAPDQFKNYGIKFPDVIGKMLESVGGNTAAPSQQVSTTTDTATQIEQEDE